MKEEKRMDDHPMQHTVFMAKSNASEQVEHELLAGQIGPSQLSAEKKKKGRMTTKKTEQPLQRETLIVDGSMSPPLASRNFFKSESRYSKTSVSFFSVWRTSYS